MAVVVESGQTRITFEKSKSGPVLSAIQTGGKDWLVKGHGQDLWKLWLRGPDGTAPVYSEFNGDYEGAEQAGSGIVLRWTLRLGGGRTGRVSVLVSPCEDSLTEWRLKVSLPDEWKLVRAEFPRIGNLRRKSGMKLLAPVGWGVDYAFLSGLNYEGRYPSWQAVMQFMGLHADDNGLYIAAHDGEAHLKDLGAHVDSEGSRVLLTHWPTLLSVYVQPYPVIIGAYSGKMEDAAAIYRRFAINTRWGQAAAEREIPQWLLDTDLWLRPDGAAEKAREATLKALKYFDVQTALHWYRWHETPYDTNYPEYFPPLPGFAETIAEFRDAGSHVTPYINGRLWDPASRSWASKNAAASAARKENGDCYSEVYGSKIPNTAMCPSTSLWRNTVADLVERLVKECGVSGVYIDQIGCAEGLPCYSTEHEHDPGGGVFWTKSYRRLVDKARTRLPKDGILTTEETAECWIDQFDGLLAVNTPAGDYDIVPLYPFVYSDRTVVIGHQYYAKEEPAASLSWRLKCARTFLWGAQLGWIQPERILAPGVEKEAEFLRDLARTRSKAHDFVYARFLGPVDVEGDVPVLKGKGPAPFGGPGYKIKTPAVLATAWKAADRRIGILAVNMADEDIEFQIDGKALVLPARSSKLLPAEE